MKKFIENLKNINIVVSFFINPITWHIKPFAKKMPRYNDEWVSAYEDEYKFSWLFIRVSLFVQYECDDDYLNLY
jgi:hypothetical protein